MKHPQSERPTAPATERTSTLQLGNYNTLCITRFTDHGAYLDGGDVGEILMPKTYVLPEMKPGDEVRVFVYLDQEERLVGTTETPLARVGEFAYLRVAWVNEYGAFLDWGLMKDLFVPFREQKRRMEKDRSYIVYIYIDEETSRIVASAKVDRFIQPTPYGRYHRGEEVDILIQQKTPLGFKVIVDNAWPGLIYDNQIYEDHRTGERLRASIVTFRPDGKLDLSLQRIGKSRFRDFAEILEERIKEAGGEIPFTDRSDSEDIMREFGVSKKTFKRAVGTLYRSRRIELLPESIRLTKK